MTEIDDRPIGNKYLGPPVVVDVGHENIAICEARKLGIPVIGVVDTNNSVDGIDYVIPGNDDAMKSIRLILSTLADAVLEGRSDEPGPTAFLRESEPAEQEEAEESEPSDDSAEESEDAEDKEEKSEKD